MDQHRARENELLDIEVLKAVEQPLRTLDCNFVVKRVRLTRNIVVGREVQDRGDPGSKAAANLVESVFHFLV